MGDKGNKISVELVSFFVLFGIYNKDFTFFLIPVG